MDPQAYAKKMEELMAIAPRLSGEAVARARALLEEARREIAAELASTEWAAYRVDSMKRAVANAMAEFDTRYGAEFGELQGRAWGLAADVLDEATAELGLGAIPQMDGTALGILQGYSADLVAGLEADAIKNISRVVSMGVLAGKTLDEVMVEIGRNLDEGEIGKIAQRAERIARTELASVQQKARQTRFDQVTEYLKKRDVRPVYKEWIHSGKGKNARKHHKALDGEVVPVGEDFPGGIPYPHAPGLAAKEVVNCGCTHVLIFPGMPNYPGPKGEDIYDGGPFL